MEEYGIDVDSLNITTENINFDEIDDDLERLISVLINLLFEFNFL